VAVDHLHRATAHLVPEVIEREVDRVLHVLSDDRGRAGQRGDEADLDPLLLRRRRQRESDARRERSGENGSDHFVLLRRFNSNRNLGLASLEDERPPAQVRPAELKCRRYARNRFGFRKKPSTSAPFGERATCRLPLGRHTKSPFFTSPSSSTMLRSSTYV